jgi:hypothetical protein
LEIGTKKASKREFRILKKVAGAECRSQVSTKQKQKHVTINVTIFQTFHAKNS